MALNTHHAVKLFALAIMTIDHVGAYLAPDLLWLRAIGRIGFPIWFFLIGHALHYRASRELWLWAAGLIAGSALLGLPTLPLNALVTIGCCQLVLGPIARHRLLERQPAALLLACLLFLVPSLYLMEYGTIGLLYALMGYAVRERMMEQWRGIAVMMVALTTFLVMQQLFFAFPPAMFVAVAVVTGLVTWYLAHFRHRPLPATEGKIGAAPALWLSRHSMQYYVLHRLAFQIV